MEPEILHAICRTSLFTRHPAFQAVHCPWTKELKERESNFREPGRLEPKPLTNQIKFRSLLCWETEAVLNFVGERGSIGSEFVCKDNPSQDGDCGVRDVRVVLKTRPHCLVFIRRDQFRLRWESLD